MGLPKNISMGDKYDPAMEIEDQAEADAYFELLVEHCMMFGMSRDDAETMERNNLGYYAGYYSGEVRARVEELYRCAHPFFGRIAVNGTPDPKTAIEMGVKMGQGWKAKKQKPE